MAYDIDKLRSLYLKYDTLAASGEDVVADLRKEINNLELAYLKDYVLPQVAQFMASKIKDLRCGIDSSFQFDGEQSINYSFCTSGSMLFVKDSIDITSVAEIPQPEITQSIVEQSAIVDSTSISTLPNKNIRIENYSKKCVAVYGDTKEFAEELKNLGGYFNPRLRGDVGWIFSKKRLPNLNILFAPYLHSQNISVTLDKEDETNLFSQADADIESILTEDQWIKMILSMKSMSYKGMIAPHKAIFMLAIIDAIKLGYIRENRIFATSTLSKCFTRIWKKYVPSEWPFRVNTFQPYIHMSGESFYSLVKAEGVKSFDLNQNWTRSSVIRYVEYAYFDNHLFELLHKQEFTDRLSKQLIDKFLCQQSPKSVVEEL